MAHKLELTALEGIGAVRPGDELDVLVQQALQRSGLVLRDGDVLVVAQKIVSKAENRYVVLEAIAPSPRAIELAQRCDKDPRVVELVLRESRTVLRAVPGVLIVEDCRGVVLANAGIDRSNVEPDAEGRERVLLLPADPDASAARLRARMRERCNADIAVIINDSIGRAWRLGTVGTSIGVSGLPALFDRRGEPDLQGRMLKITQVGLADELAAAASALMGQAAEGRPMVLVRGGEWPRAEGAAAELQRPPERDLFR